MTLAEKFYAEGEQEGWQKGKMEGEQEGWHKGQSEGQLAGQRKAVLSVLEARFGIVPLEARQKIMAMQSEAELSKTLRLAVTSTSFVDFTAQIC